MATTPPVTVSARTARIPLEHPNTPFLRLARWVEHAAIRRHARAGPGHDAQPPSDDVDGPAGTDGPEMVEPRPGRSGTRRAAVSAQIGCSWCIDFGYFLSHNRGMDPAKLEGLADWRASDAYTSLERQVLEYAEAMTTTPPSVTDEMVEGLRESLTDDQLVELTAMIALENLRSRTNAALGLTSQGFKDHCEVPSR